MNNNERTNLRNHLSISFEHRPFFVIYLLLHNQIHHFYIRGGAVVVLVLPRALSLISLSFVEFFVKFSLLLLSLSDAWPSSLVQHTTYIPSINPKFCLSSLSRCSLSLGSRYREEFFCTTMAYLSVALRTIGWSAAGENPLRGKLPKNLWWSSSSRRRKSSNWQFSMTRGFRLLFIFSFALTTTFITNCYCYFEYQID